MYEADDVGQYRDRFSNEGTAVYALYALKGHKHTWSGGALRLITSNIETTNTRKESIQCKTHRHVNI